MALGVQGGVVASLAALAAYLLVTRHSQQAGEVTRRSQQTGEAPAAAQRDAAPSAPGPAVEHRLHPLFGSSALLHEGDVLSPHHAGALSHMKAEMEACRLQPPVAYSETANYTQCDGAVLWEWDGYWQYRSRTAYHAYGHPDIDALAARAKGIITRTLASPRSPVGHPAAPKCQLRLRDIRFFLYALLRLQARRRRAPVCPCCGWPLWSRHGWLPRQMRVAPSLTRAPGRGWEAQEQEGGAEHVALPLQREAVHQERIHHCRVLHVRTSIAGCTPLPRGRTPAGPCPPLTTTPCILCLSTCIR